MRFDQVTCADGLVIQANVEESLRVRYSKTDGERKNTLLTFAEKDRGNLFFGIARCNLAEGDRFSKKRGRAIAASRLKQALESFSFAASQEDFNLLMMSTNLLRGVCPVSRVKDLLEYFRDIDQKIDRERQAGYQMRRDSHMEREMR